MNHFEQIKAKLDEFGIDAMLVTSFPGELYAAGFHGEGAVVVGKNETCYFTDSRYIESAQKQIKNAAVDVTGVGRPLRTLVCQAVERMGVRRLGFEDGYMTVEGYHGWADVLKGCELVPANGLIGSYGLRASKDAEELELVRHAQSITDRAFSEILNYIKPGMTEREVAAKLVYDQLRFGADKMSFDPIVVTAANGSLPHGIPGDTVIEQGSFVTMDFGCIYHNYCSDMTRTIAVGKPTDEMKTVYNTVLKAQLAGISAAKAGVPGRDIHNAAAQVIADAGYGAYFGHGFGHGVGIEIHEFPSANSSAVKPVTVGSVISAEPGIYLPGRFGVRIEDVLIITEDGCEDITKSPKELIIL